MHDQNTAQVQLAKVCQNVLISTETQGLKEQKNYERGKLARMCKYMLLALLGHARGSL